MNGNKVLCNFLSTVLHDVGPEIVNMRWRSDMSITEKIELLVLYDGVPEIFSDCPELYFDDFVPFMVNEILKSLFTENELIKMKIGGIL